MATPDVESELKTAQRAIRPAAWTSSAAGGALFLGGHWMLWTILERFQTSRCPRGTFLSAPAGWLGSELPALFATFLALGSASFLFGLALSWKLAGEKTWRRWAVAEYGGKPNHFSGLIKFFSISTAVWSLLAAPVDYAYAHHQICLSPNSIHVARSWRSQFVTHSWSEVTYLQTDCRRGRGGWGVNVELELKNGERFSLNNAWGRSGTNDQALAYGRWVRTIPLVWDALHPYQGTFDSSGVAPGCPRPERPYLVERP